MKNLIFSALVLFNIYVVAQVAPTPPPPPPAPSDVAKPPVPPAAPPSDTTVINVGKTIKVQIVDKNKKAKGEKEELEIKVDSDNFELSEEIEAAIREAFKGLENINVDIDIDHNKIEEQLREAQRQMQRAKEELRNQLNRMREQQDLDNEEAQREMEEAEREMEEAQRELEEAQEELQRELEMLQEQELKDRVRVKVRTHPDSEEAVHEIIHKEKKKSRIKTRYILFDMGVSTYLNNGSFNMPDELSNFEQRYGRSLDYNLHAFRQKISFAQNHLNISYGLGFNFSNYSFDNPITLVKNTNPLEVLVNENMDYKKNKLVTTVMNIPLMFGYESNPKKSKKSFRIGAGVYGGLLIGAHTRQKSDEEGNDKVRDDFNLNKLRYGFVGTIGIGPINFYTNYAPQSLFKDNRGPDLQPLNIGISLIPF